MSTDDQFCIAGGQLPSLYLLGVPKCGTTSLASQLRDEYGVSYNTKEYHLWDGVERHMPASAWRRSLAGYMDRRRPSRRPPLPACDRAILSADCTARYLSQGVQALVAAYGPARLRKTAFAVLLCDPLQRAQSHFYMNRLKGQSDDGNGRYWHRNATSFRALASASAAAAEWDRLPGGGGNNITVWRRGEYGPLLDRLLQLLPAGAANVAVIPSVLYFKHARRTIESLLAFTKRVTGRAPSRAPPHAPRSNLSEAAPRRNARRHPKLEVDVGAGPAAAIARHFRSSNARVYALLKAGTVAALPYLPVEGRDARFLETEVLALWQPGAEAS